MLSRPQIVAGVTVAALGALTAVAIHAGNTAVKEKQPAPKVSAPKPVVKTVVVHRTIPTKAERRRAAARHRRYVGRRAARRKKAAAHRRAVARREAAAKRAAAKKRN